MRNFRVNEFGPVVESLEGRECFSVLPYGGGVSVAVGDVNGDGSAVSGVHVAMGDGSVRFRVDGVSLADGFKGGVFVGAGVVTDNKDGAGAY